MLRSRLRQLDSPEPINYLLWALLVVLFNFTNLLFLHAIYPTSPKAMTCALAGVEFRTLFLSCGFFAILHLVRKLEFRKMVFFLNLGAIFAVGYAYVSLPVYTATGMDIATAVSMIRQEGHGFMAMVRDAGMSRGQFNRYCLALLVAAALAGVAAHWTERITMRLKFSLRLIHIAALGLASVALMIAEQDASPRWKDTKAWVQEVQTLPFYVLVHRLPETGRASALIRLRPFQRMDLEAERMHVVSPRLPSDLNVFLIVFDTFRKDFLDPALTPNLAQFASESLRFSRSFAGANATHEAWFAIFDSGSPLYWNAFRGQPDMRGSPPFLLLRNAGFRHRVFSSSDLTYFNYNTIIFGRPGSIADIHYRDGGIGVSENDRRAVAHLLQEMATHPSGRNIYSLLIESGHHPYFLPSDVRPTYLPVVPDFDYTKTSYSTQDVEKIRNRYKNTVVFEDQLFGEFIARLKEWGLYRDAVIIVCGDHGEEFMEHGVLVHSSRLDREQTETPILFKLPHVQPELRHGVMSAVDILPTLLDYLGFYDDRTKRLMNGRSILRTDGQPFALTAAIRGASIPTHFSLTDGEYKLLFSLNMNERLDANRLRVDDIVDMNDQPYAPANGSRSDLIRFIEKHFRTGLRQIGIFESIGPF